MSEGFLKASQTLEPLLARFRVLATLPLRNVWQVIKEGSVDCIIMEFESASLAVNANADDDTLSFSVVQGAVDRDASAENVGERQPWKDFIGKPFGWGWLAISQQGYPDMVILSFEATVFPEVVLNCVASSIKVGTVKRITA